MRECGPRGRITAGRDAHTHRRHAPLPPLKQIITRFGMWGTAFLTGCWNQIAAVLITLAILGAMVWLYWHGWLWYGALALIVGMLAVRSSVSLKAPRPGCDVPSFSASHWRPSSMRTATNMTYYATTCLLVVRGNGSSARILSAILDIFG